MSIQAGIYTKRKLNITWGTITWFIMLLIMLFVIIFLIYVMFKYSIADRASIITGGKYPEPLWPFQPNFDQYKNLFGKRDFIISGIFSLEVALFTVIFSLILGAPVAFVMSRYKFPGLGSIAITIIAIRFFPDIVAVIPVAEWFLKPPLVYLPAMVQVSLAHTVLSLPYVVYICQGIFEAIPKDLEEKARILGASKLYAFLHVIVPVVLPGIAAVAIYTFLLSWNEFIYAYFLLFQSANTTLPVYMLRLLTWTPQRNYLVALAVILSLPVILFTFLVQRYMITGMTAGAVK